MAENVAVTVLTCGAFTTLLLTSAMDQPVFAMVVPGVHVPLTVLG